MNVNPAIFREYDIRGVIDTGFSEKAVAEYEKWYGSFPGVTLPDEVVQAIGKAYGTFIQKESGKKVIVGYEIRPSAERIKELFIEGILSSGCDVADIDVALTPLVYFTVAHGGYDGGVNITGSHNVYFYNGFKLMKRGVQPLFGEELQEMKQMIIGDRIPDSTRRGTREFLEAFPVYLAYLTTHITLSKKLKVVVDCGNGSAGIFAPQILRKLGCDVIELYTAPDATFPNHIPDPEQSQFLDELRELVVKEHADVGIAFDADGDRVGFVDETGVFWEADLITLLFAKDVLSRNPGKKILFDIKSSLLLSELVPQFGGISLMHRTGHAPIKDTLRKDPEIIFGGEKSGHFFFVEDYFRIDDGLWAASRMLEIIAREGALSALMNAFPKRVATPEFKLPCADEKKFEVVKRISESLSRQYPSIAVDGIRFTISPTGWGLIRASNTSPYLTARAEGVDEEEVKKIKSILADELERFPEVIDRLDRSVVARLGGRLGWV
ncbi:MAG: hypothetical protein A2131_01120 [Candidatus Sungbacteria bacterium GWC2_49_10]|uniref:Phosphomannomutase n=1 Tax=Candidatus Sungbacteria bacterium GWC2_49_10 TaxID=1802263 RepID=A0A1G2K6V3_9BACT|nr:MAG: hypothetical protein A2131_01120 [Candidatus Sungbacteria bacterium GWC2_49_10]